MNKSTMYKFAQIAVVESANLPSMLKLDILRELMQKEDTARYLERAEENEDGNK